MTRDIGTDDLKRDVKRGSSSCQPRAMIDSSLYQGLGVRAPEWPVNGAGALMVEIQRPNRRKVGPQLTTRSHSGPNDLSTNRASHSLLKDIVEVTS